MMTSTLPRFFFTGHAVAFAGRVTLPFDEQIEAQAATALPVTGGYGSARVENFRYREFYSFRSAYSSVSGIYNFQSQSWESLVTVTIEGLNILSLLTADRVIGRFTSSHPNPDGKDVPEKGYHRERRLEGPFISPLGSSFENLRVAGSPVEFEIDPDVLSETATWPSFVRALAKDKKRQQRYNREEGWGDPQGVDMALGSIFKDFTGSIPGVHIERNVFTVPDFGKIFFGEFLVSPYLRRLIMFRIELGCPIQGKAVGCDLIGDGHSYPARR